MKKVYFLLLMLCLSVAGRSQTAASYTFTRSTGTYTSIAGGPGTTAVSGWTSVDDGYVGSIPIGFTFTFCGVGRTTLSACSNGWLSLTNYLGANYPGSPGAIGSQGWLFALWHDAYGASPSQAYYQTSGTAPNRVFTFEWQNWSSCCSYGPMMNVQIKLLENGNIIQMCYGTYASTPSVSIGIANSSSDYQTLTGSSSTTCSSSSWSYTTLPSNGSILQWALQCGTIVPGAVSATVTNDCAGFASTLNLTGASGEPGISYQWQSSPDSITWSNVSGATTATYSTTVNSTVFYRNRLGCSFTSTNANTAGRKLTNNTPGVIGGANAVCINATTPFTNTTLGGDWVSTAPAIATVGTTGLVQGISQGTAIISYTSLGCSVSKTVAVNPLPSVFNVAGGGSYCLGGAGVNVTLSNSATGFEYQLYNGSTPTGSPIAGLTGSARTFGPLPVAGTYTVTARNTTTGCLRDMNGNATVVVNPVPGVTNGPLTICQGLTGLFLNPVAGGTWSSSNTAIATANPATGVVTGVSGGIATITYTLPAGCYVTKDVTINPAVPAIGGVANVCAGLSTTLTNAVSGGVWSSSTPAVATIGSVSGSVSGVMAGATTMTYTLGTGCLNTVAFTVNPLPAAITGSTNFCLGGTTTLGNTSAGGTWSSSDISIATAGLSTGVISGITAGATNVIYTLPTGCVQSTLVNVTPLPQVYNVTGGGGYCLGGTPPHVFLSFSNPGISYQLRKDGVATGIPQAGTGAMLDFGEQPAVGVYTIVATNTTSSCTNNMAGSVTISINPLPAPQTVSGTGNYCEGGTGRNVYLDASVSGISYQLYNGLSTVGAAMAGTGLSIDFGAQTTPGAYTVVATNTTTGCTNNMTGSAVIGINYLPTGYAVTGGGSYCSGGSGVSVILNGSDNAISYQLYKDGSTVGAPIIGVTGPVDFGLKTATGSYNVIATNTSTGCVKTMDGSVAISINPLPAAVAVTGGGNFCVGGLGVNVGTGFSNSGINYNLYRDLVNLGITLPGTGAALDFGLQTTPGTYTIVAENAITHCTADMTGSAVVGTTPLPTTYVVTGGGSYCSGGNGVRIGLRASNPGISYQLYNGTLPVGSSVAGTGSPLDFGLHTTPGTYTVMATNSTTLCSSEMIGSATVSINPVPNIYSVSGGGAYCSGGAGSRVGLSNSQSGISYQLLRDGSSLGLPLSGIDTVLDFGFKTLAGDYTVKAVNNTTGCSSNMSGTATIAINPLPTAFTVTGGGSYCSTDAGLSVGLSGSATGVEYQLWNSSGAVGSPLLGTGGSLDFGLQTAGGIYTVTALNTTTLCSNNMAGSTMIIVNAAPAAHIVTGGGAYCAGGTGSVIGIDGSDIAIDYQLYNGTSPVGLAWHGTGAPIAMGSYAVPGTYTVRASNIVTTCGSGMTGTATVSINPLVTPSVSISSVGGLNSCASAVKILNATPVNGGTTPAYVWNVNGIDITGSDTADYAYVPVNGDIVKVTMTSNAVCPTATTATSEVVLGVLANGTPTISISANTADTVCAGTAVTFTAASTFGGLTPNYTWYKNGVEIGRGSWVVTNPFTGDRIICGMRSDYTCRTTDSATSNQKVMANIVVPTPVVTITASPVVVGLGLYDTLRATVVNGGSTPSFQWVVNGSIVPSATSSTFISNHFSNRDSVACMVMSSHVCGGVAGSGHIIVRVRNVGVDDVTKNNNIAVMPNPSNGSFVVKGTFGSIDNQQVTIEVTNMLGQVVYNTKANVQNGVINEKVQLSNNIAAGMYMLNLRSETENAVFHIMVQQ